jgi:hypothetical protein
MESSGQDPSRRLAVEPPDVERAIAALYGDGDPDEIAVWTVQERRRGRRERADADR